MKDFIDKTSESSGTPINREALMDLQGFGGVRIDFENDGSIVETNSENQTKRTTFNADGSIEEVFVGIKTIKKTTIFNDDGSISEVIS